MTIGHKCKLNIFNHWLSIRCIGKWFLTIKKPTSSKKYFFIKKFGNKKVRDNGSIYMRSFDAPPSSLMDSTANPRVEIMEGERVGAHSLACNTWGVEGRAGAPRWD
jgi:hypothetical protein